MELNLIICALCFLVYINFVASEHGPAPIAQTLIAKRNETMCQHHDYKSYIKCLIRKKRHHEPHVHGDYSHSCLNSCGIEKCEYQSCTEQCYERCFKKTKEIHHITREYENSCESRGDCEHHKGVVNITTNIDINNIINNTNFITVDKDQQSGSKSDDGYNGHGKPSWDHKTKPTKKVDWDSVDSRNSSDSNGDRVGPGNNGGKPLTPETGMNENRRHWYPGLGLNLVPQIQLVPQISFGIGLGPVGAGCVFGTLWPCLQPQDKDCSGCGQPYPQYRCDVSCYPSQGSPHQRSPQQRSNARITEGRSPDNIPCKSPHCVGGAQ